MALGIAVPATAAVIGIVPSAARSLGMTFCIAVPATVPAAASPVVIIVIVVARSRPDEPSLVIPCRHGTTIIVIVPATAGRTSAIIPIVVVVADKTPELVVLALHGCACSSCHLVLLRWSICPGIGSNAERLCHRRAESSRLYLFH